jgi:hypothetical protein
LAVVDQPKSSALRRLSIPRGPPRIFRHIGVQDFDETGPPIGEPRLAKYRFSRSAYGRLSSAVGQNVSP